MGKSLPRTCKACNAYLKGDFNKHRRVVCQPKNGFKGWVFHDRKGKKVREEHLPTRITRVIDTREGDKFGGAVKVERDEEKKAWQRIKRASVFAIFNAKIRRQAFKHFVKILLIDSKRFNKNVLKKLVSEAADDIRE